jgi:UDP-N-acetylglucosamine 2-epimerase (non-hydrolysing)
MIDTLLRHKEWALAVDVLGKQGLEPGSSALLTLHRPSDVDVPEVLSGILDALAEIQDRLPVLFPAHPRTVRRVWEFGFEGKLAAMPDLRVMEPLAACRSEKCRP